MKPVEIEYLIKNGTRATLEQISADLLKVGADGEQSGDAISASFVRTEAQAALLRDVVSTLEAKLLELQSVNPDIDQSANIAEAEKLKTTIEELKTQLVQLEQTGENTQVLPNSLPTAKQQFNGLHMSIQQMAREMPSLAMGPQMFFLAISNNLPIFTDELARAKKEYAELIKTGQKGTPVWKQVVKSLFSWQTALTTGIMLLVMYGDEIMKSISDMTGWGAAERARREEMEKTIEIEKEAIGIASKNRIEIGQTIKSIENFIGNKDEERQKVDELNTKYGKSFGCYQTLSAWYDTLTTKSEAYTKVLYLQAKQQSLLAKAVEADQKVEEIKKTPAEDVEGSMGLGQKVLLYFGQGNGGGFDAETLIDEFNADNKTAEISNAKAKRDAYLEDMDNLHAKEVELIKDNNFNKIITPITENNTEQQYQNARLSSLREAANAELEIERSKITDKIALIEFERDAKIEALEAEKQAYKDKYGDDADVSGFDRQIKATSDQADVDIAIINDNASKEEADKRARINEETLQKFATFRERYETLLQEHEANKRAIQEAGGDAANEAVAEEQYEAKVAALNSEVLGSIDEFKQLADGVVDAEIDKMLEILTKAQSEMAMNGASPAEYAAVNAEMARLIALKKKNAATSDSRSLKEWQDMESQLKSCTSTLSEMGDEIGGVAGESISAAGDVAGSLTSMVSGIVMLVENGVSGMTAAGKAGTNALKAVETASVILAVIGAVISLVTKLYNLIEGGKKEALQDEIDMYNELMSTYDTLIDKQKELLNNSKQATALEAYNKALDMVDAKQDAAAASLRKWFKSGAGLFSHSEGYNYNEEFGDKLSQSQLFSMDAAQWEDWMTNNAKTWASLPDEVRNYAQAIMDSGVQTEELQAAWKEFMTGFTIDDARSSLLDMLNDFDTKAEDVADNFTDHFTQAINKVVANGLDDDLVEWYDDLAEAMKGGLTKEEREPLEAEYKRIVKEGQDQRDAAYEVTGYKPDDSPTTQSGKPGAFMAMDQDQGTKLEGLFTANEMRTARIEGKVETVASQMDTAVGHLERIEKNTENSAQSLKNLDEKIDRIIRDGIKVN